MARAITHLGGQATALLPAGGPTGAHLVELLQQEGVSVDALPAHDWTRQNLHVVSEATGEQFRFVMPGAALHDQPARGALDQPRLRHRDGRCGGGRRHEMTARLRYK